MPTMLLWVLEAACSTVRDTNLTHIPDDTKFWWGKCKLQGGLEQHHISPTIAVLAPVSRPPQAYGDIGVPYDQHTEKGKKVSFLNR